MASISPVRMIPTASAEGQVPLKHPTPDLSRHSSFRGNVASLEQNAETLSQGTDIGEEISKLKEELKRQHSERNSRRSSLVDRQAFTQGLTVRRRISNGSFSSSMVGVYGDGRWGGYTPSAQFSSPKGTVRSRSGSHASANNPTSADARPRQSSQLPETEQDVRLLDTNMAYSPKSPTYASQIQFSPSHAYYSIPSCPASQEPPDDDGRVPSMIEAKSQPKLVSEDGLYRSTSQTSTNGVHRALSIFKDFDGVHYTPIIEESDEVHFDLSTKRDTWVEPPPRDNMVYYPAPVPRTLNLPNRLSTRGGATLLAKRRTQVFATAPEAARQSTAELPQSQEQPPHDLAEEPSGKNRINSSQTLRASALPAQLRANIFFDRPPVPQEMPIRHESAIATLDHFLDASAITPADAFVNHPIVGHTAFDVYAKERVRKSAYNALDSKSDARKSKMSLLSGRKSTADVLHLLKRRSGSRLSLNTDLSGGHSRDAGDEHSACGDQGSHLSTHDHLMEGHLYEEYDEGFDGDSMEEGNEDADQYEDLRAFGAPTTLLAELQMRKSELKQRNRTAIQAFPNGMHATLLELDAVAQIEKKKRKGQPTTLAWEDPTTKTAADEHRDDEDVPLGVLFPKKGLIDRAGLDDWDRPLGLIEKRHVEDNEPLSRRRTRLLGINPDVPPPTSVVDQEADDDSEHGDETLAQRTRRLRNQETLNAALPKVDRPASAEFSKELLKHIGVEDPETADDPIAERKTPDGIEETLGQRRKRLQAEAGAGAGAQARQASGNNKSNSNSGPPTRSVTPNSMNLATLLAAHPVTATTSSSHHDRLPLPKVRLNNHGMLYQAEQQNAQHRQQLLQHNMGQRIQSNEFSTRPTSYGILDKDYNAQSRFRQDLAFQNAGRRQVSNESQGQPLSHQLPGTTGLLGQNEQTQAYQRSILLEQQSKLYPSMRQHLSRNTKSFMGDAIGNGFGGNPWNVGHQYGSFNDPSADGLSGYAMMNYAIPSYGVPMMAPGYYPQMMHRAGPAMEPPALLQPNERDMIENWRQSVL